MYSAEDLAEVTVREAVALALRHAPSPFSYRLIGHILAHHPDKELVDYGAPVDLVFSATAKIQLDQNAVTYYDQTAMMLIELRGFMTLFGLATVDEDADGTGPAAEPVAGKQALVDGAAGPAAVDDGAAGPEVDGVFSTAVVGLLVEKVMSSACATSAARLAAVNKFLPRSGLADFYPVIPGTLGSATRKALLQQVKAARQKLVVRWAQATTEARLATAVNTLTADLAATADARQFLAMYEAAIVARAATIAKEETDPGLDTGVLTGVGGGAALDKKGDDNGATAIADCSSSDMVPAPSNSDGGTAAAATGAAPRSTASPAKRARTAAPSPRRKRARPSASPRRPTAQPSPSRHPVSPSSQSQPSVSLLHPAHDTDTPDTADATAADDEHSSSAGVDAGPAGGSSGVTSGKTLVMSGTHTTSRRASAAAPAAAPARRTTRAGSATTPVASQSPASQVASQVPETQELFMPKSQYPRPSSDDDEDEDETQMTQGTPIWECVEIRGHRKATSASGGGDVNGHRGRNAGVDFLVAWKFEGKLLKKAEWVAAAHLADEDKQVPQAMVDAYLAR